MCVLTGDFRADLYGEIAELWRLTGVGRPERGDDLARIQHTLRNGGKMICALEGGKVVGTSWLTQDGRRVYVHHMAVHPSHQGRGIGRRLLAASLEAAAALGLQVKLEVHQDNAAALRIYRDAGFVTLEGYVSMIRRSTSAPGSCPSRGGEGP
ncbi:MAG: GNAT family N-acetyltransferase [Acidobacteria bacterium]|nr:GNAT family N-acetyltransferase [Acidobacteriota bacterium]